MRDTLKAKLPESDAQLVDSAVERIDGELRRLRDQVRELEAASSAKGKASHHDADEADLPPVLRRFRPLSHGAELQALTRSRGLADAEAAVLAQPDSEAALDTLGDQLQALTAAFRAAIDAQLRLPNILGDCAIAVEAGNRDFLGVYEAVWTTILHAEEEGVAAYRKAVAAATFPGAGALQGCGSDVVGLYRDAARTKPAYDRAVRAVIASLELDADQVRLVLPGSLKRTPRIVEKSLLRPDVPGACDRVLDVVRGMVVVKRMAVLARVVAAFCASEACVLVRCKERFVANVSGGGWRDFMLNFYLRGSGRAGEDQGHGHVCEVQVVHETMLNARKGLPGHVIYSRVRNAAEIAEALQDFGHFGLTAAEADVAGVGDAKLTAAAGRVAELETLVNKTAHVVSSWSYERKAAERAVREAAGAPTAAVEAEAWRVAERHAHLVRDLPFLAGAARDAREGLAAAEAARQGASPEALFAALEALQSGCLDVGRLVEATRRYRENADVSELVRTGSLRGMPPRPVRVAGVIDKLAAEAGGNVEGGGRGGGGVAVGRRPGGGSGAGFAPRPTRGGLAPRPTMPARPT